MKANKIMALDVVAVPVDFPVEQAHQLMRKLEVRHLPVLAEGRLAGIVSDRDILLVSGSRGASGELVYPQLSTGEVMSVAPIAAEPDLPVSQLAKLMIEAKIDSLPIISAKGDLLGLVTSTDLLRVLAELPGEAQPTLSYHLRRVDPPARA